MRHDHDPSTAAGAGAIAAMIFFAGLSALLPLLFWLSTSS
jgi:hypothetical protein